MTTLLDPKWLDILKASGWQTAAIAAGCGVIFWLIATEALPDPGPTIIVVVAGAGIICASLAAAAGLSATAKPARRWLAAVRGRYALTQSCRSYLPHLTEKERAIFAHLLHKNEKSFTASVDGGYASTLISRGLIVQAVRPGQMVDSEHVPCTIPDAVWEELVRHKDQFPPPKKLSPHPWRVPGW
jgi:hypothetical protein